MVRFSEAKKATRNDVSVGLCVSVLLVVWYGLLRGEHTGY